MQGFHAKVMQSNPQAKQPLHQPLFNHISKTEMSEGETPGIRDACPKVDGFKRLSFSLAS